MDMRLPKLQKAMDTLFPRSHLDRMDMRLPKTYKAGIDALFPGTYKERMDTLSPKTNKGLEWIRCYLELTKTGWICG